MINKSINSFCTKLESLITAAILNYAPIWLSIFGMHKEILKFRMYTFCIINHVTLYVLGIVGICSAVIVLYKPGLQLPESSHFQLFVSNHPFEIYNSKLKNEFWFEKSMSVSKICIKCTTFALAELSLDSTYARVVKI